MDAVKMGWSLVAVLLLSTGGLTMTQLVATQPDDQPKSATAKPNGAESKKPTPAEPKLEEKRGLSKFMRMKLEASQKVLAGLALEDFELIQEGATKLEEMSTAEKWRVSQDPLFRAHSDDFQRIAKRLNKNAKDGKLEAAALTWLEATMQCIECHKWSRANLIAKD